MKPILFIITLLLLRCFDTLAQIEVPVIEKLTVDPISGKPYLQWKIDNPNEVDGYIIKRMILDGDGVISGTFNNVAVIDNNMIFSYIDNSTAYNTEARPNIRRETYRVSAYKIVDGMTHYSLMSDEFSTLLISGSYSYCNQAFNISCTEIANNPCKYKFFCSDISESVDSNNPQATIPTANMSTNWNGFEASFHVETGDNCILGSPEIVIKVDNPEPPSLIKISKVESLLDFGLVRLTMSLSNVSHLGKVCIMRSNSSGTEYIDLTISEMDNFVYDDYDANLSIINKYQIVIFDHCDKIFATSEIVESQAVAYPEPKMLIPNAFNINSDNDENRFFHPLAENIKDYKMLIFNKRGAVIFQSNEISVGWNGYDRQSKLCPRDTYFYIITYKSLSGKNYENKGFVNLIYN